MTLNDWIKKKWVSVAYMVKGRPCQSVYGDFGEVDNTWSNGRRNHLHCLPPPKVEQGRLAARNWARRNVSGQFLPAESYSLFLISSASHLGGATSLIWTGTRRTAIHHDLLFQERIDILMAEIAACSSSRGGGGQQPDCKHGALLLTSYQLMHGKHPAWSYL